MFSNKVSVVKHFNNCQFVRRHRCDYVAVDVEENRINVCVFLLPWAFRGRRGFYVISAPTVAAGSSLTDDKSIYAQLLVQEKSVYTIMETVCLCKRAQFSFMLLPGGKYLEKLPCCQLDLYKKAVVTVQHKCLITLRNKACNSELS